MQAVDLPDGEPLGVLGEVDEPEPARGEDHGLGRGRGALRLRHRLVVIAEHDLALDQVVLGRSGEHPGPGVVLVPGVGDRGAHRGQALVGRGRGEDLALAQRVLDQVAELDPVALAEGPALALAVIREDDEVVGARGALDRPLESRELAVVLLQDGERVGSSMPEWWATSSYPTKVA